jgi:hypothetical protein
MNLLGTGHQVSGKNSAVEVNNVFLNFAKFDVTYKGDDQDTTNFQSQGYGEAILGLQQCDISFGGLWDASPNNPFGNPPGLYPRDDLSAVLLYPSYIPALQGVYWDFPYMRVRSAHNSAEVKSAVAFDVSGMSQGPFQLPVGGA